jgi:hypothetical protein
MRINLEYYLSLSPIVLKRILINFVWRKKKETLSTCNIFYIILLHYHIYY